MSIDQPSDNKQDNLMHRQSRDGGPLWPTVLIKAISSPKLTKIIPPKHQNLPHKGLCQSLDVSLIIESSHDATRRLATIPIDTP